MNKTHLFNFTNQTIETNYENFFATCLKIRDYGSIACFAIGLVLNYVIIRYFCKKDQMNYVSISIYVISLALVHQFKLLFELPFDLFLSNKWSEIFCEIHSWGRYTFGEASSWIIVFLAIDRLLIFRLVDIDHEIKINKKQKAWRVLVVCSIFSVFLFKNGIFYLLNLIDPLSFFPFFKFKTCIGYKLTDHSLINKQILLEYASYNLTHQVLYSYLPAVIILLFDFNIVYLMQSYLREPKSDLPDTDDSKTKQVKKNEASIGLISLVFLITNLPCAIYTTITDYKTLAVANDIKYYDGIGYLLNLFELFGFFFNFFALSFTYKRLFSQLKNLPMSMFKKKKKYKFTMNDNNFVSNETNL